MAELLNQAGIDQAMTQLSDWELEGKKIKRVYEFKDFVAAINFVNKLVEPAEAAGHHPDLEVSYNKVTVSLTSHDAGGLTSADFEMAAKVDEAKAQV